LLKGKSKEEVETILRRLVEERLPAALRGSCGPPSLYNTLWLRLLLR
jgi:hypothetical protein